MTDHGAGFKKIRPAITDLIDGKECVSVSKAAEIAGVSRHAIMVRFQRGTLPQVRAGSRWYVPLEALDEIASLERMWALPARGPA